MTVPSTARRAGPYTGNGSTTTFSFSFKTFAAGDLQVTRTSATGIETTLVLNSDYSVSLNGDQDASPGGTITYPISGAALASGQKLTIVGNLAYEQTTDLLGGGAFNAKVIEDTFDRTVIQIQQLEERADRALALPVSAASVSTTLPVPEGSALLGWNGGGTALQNVPLSSLATAVAYGSMRYQTFVGNGTAITFALPHDPATVANLDVSIAGVVKVPGTDYTLVGQNVVFTSAPPNGATILVRYGQALGSVPSDSNDISFQAAGTNAVARTAQSKMRDVVSVKDFGAVGDGVTDDTAAIQAALTAAEGGTLYGPEGTYIITATINLPSNILVQLDPLATIQSANTGISLLKATSKTNVRVRGGKLKYTAAGSTGLIGGIEFNTSTHCLVEDVDFEGMQFSAVFLTESNYCRVIGNKVSSSLGTHSDANDFCVYNNSSYNIVESNKCLGTGAHGVLVQGAGVTIPLRNKVIRNYVSSKTAYGIIAYQITANNTYTEISGNVVRDISGSALAGASGSGIYVQTSGGCIVTDNEVSNCNTSTTSTTNLPAGISIASSTSAIAPTVVKGNRVNQPNYYGIAATGQSVDVSNNYVYFTDSTNGRGIHIQNCVNSTICANTVEMPSTMTRQGILLFAAGGAVENVTIQGNTIRGGNEYLLDCVATTGSVTGVSIVGNTMIGGGANALGIVLRSVARISVVGNYVQATFAGVYVEAGTDVRGSANVCRSTRTLLTGGSCARVFFDQTNEFDISTSTSYIQNSAADCALEQRYNAAPATGNWQVGDRIEQSVPVVGQPKGWRCTVAGSPGTWVSEGNL